MDLTYYRNGRINLRFLPLLVWLITAAGVVFVFSKQAKKFEVVGFAQENLRQISATSTGRLKSVNVKLYQQVSRGQILASLEDDEVLAELATAQAEIQRLQAELAATDDRLMVEAVNEETDAEASRRQFALDAERYHLRVLELQASLGPDLIRLEDLKLEIGIEKDLYGKGAVATNYAVAKAQVAYDTLAKTVEENQNLLTQAQAAWQKASQRQAEFSERQAAHYSVEVALNPIRQSIKVQQNKLEELKILSSALTLTSPADGVVSAILGKAGETVLAGEPIITITEQKPTEIVSYVNEIQASRVKEGDKVQLIKGGDMPKILYSKVNSVGPAVVEMPVRLWHNPDVPQWGRPLLIGIPAELELIPGESIGIRWL